jgi:hypothetical protein
MDNWRKIGCGEGDSREGAREGAVDSLRNDGSRKEDRRSGEVARTGGRGWKGVHGLEREMLNGASLSALCFLGVQGREEETAREISRTTPEPGFAGLLPLLEMGRL